MREKRWFPILYMFVVSACFSSVVIGFTAATRQRVEANEKLAFERAVVSVLPDMYEPGLSGVEVHQRFTEQVTEPSEGTAGAYTLQRGGQIVAYALPISGQGFWAPIKGIIGIEADRQTVTGIAFYEQNETPGLGAEITEPVFREQFENLALSPEGKPINMERPGAELESGEVHAVTGATQTSVRVEKIINTAVQAWRSEVGRPGVTS
jgi:Na+-transporting NADH:ubiquinone oxidoreductase subunit C